MSKKPKKENPKTAKDTQKIRVGLKKNRQERVRQQNLTHRLLSDDDRAEDVAQSERVVSRSDVSRKRTMVGVRSEGEQLIRTVDETCQPGRVVSFIGLNCRIQADDGREFECTVRGVLRSLARDSRNMIVTGDRVLFRQQGDAHQGVIERVEPRTTVLSRGSQGREHVLVANVDQVLIVASAADPDFKPQLVDRFVMSAEQRRIRPLVCINKADLADSSELLNAVRGYGRAGYPVILTSVRDGRGIVQLRSWLQGRQTVVSGQSGVGKSSLLNSADPALQLKTGDVSGWTQKGTHTTRRSRLISLSFSGWVVDTPGIRQFELWDIQPDDADAYFLEFRPFVAACRFPNCSHIHENGCGVREALTQQLISEARYRSYVRLREEDIFVWKNPARGTARETR